MKTNQSIKLLFISIIVIFSLQADGQTINFSGHWVINEAKSDFAGLPSDLMYHGLIINQNKASLTITGIKENKASQPTTVSYPLNGNEISLLMPNGLKMIAMLSWDGSYRILTRNSNYYPNDHSSEKSYESKEIWDLSEDKETLTLNRTFTMASGNSIQIVAVYERSKD